MIGTHQPRTDRHALPANRQEAVSRSSQTLLVPVLTFCTFVAMLHTMIIGPLMPEIAADLNTSVAMLGQIPAVTMLLAAGLGLITGPLADRIGYTPALVFGLLTITLSAAGMAIAPGLLLLLVASLVGAIGRAMVQPVATAIASVRFSGAEQRRAVSLVSAGIMGSFMAGVPLLTTVTSVFGWRMAMVALASITLLLIALFLFTGDAPTTSQTASSQAEPTRESIWSAYLPILHHPPTLGLIASLLLGHAAAFVLTTYLGAFAVEHHGSSTAQVGWLYAAFGAALLAGSLVAGGRISGVPLRPLLIAVRVVAGLAMAMILAIPLPLGGSVALLVTAGTAIGLQHVAMALSLIKESPAGKATTLTLMTVTLSLGIAFGNGMGGLLLSIGDFSLLGLVALLFSLASAALVWMTRQRPTPMAAGKR